MGNRLSKIATRTGDDGSTGLGDGSRTGKDSLRVQAIGEVDELNSQLGLLLCEALPAALREELLAIQHDLFDLGGELCIPGYRLQRVEDGGGWRRGEHCRGDHLTFSVVAAQGGTGVSGRIRSACETVCACRRKHARQEESRCRVRCTPLGPRLRGGDREFSGEAIVLANSPLKTRGV